MARDHFALVALASPYARIIEDVIIEAPHHNGVAAVVTFWECGERWRASGRVSDDELVALRDAWLAADRKFAIPDSMRCERA